MSGALYSAHSVAPQKALLLEPSSSSSSFRGSSFSSSSSFQIACVSVAHNVGTFAFASPRLCRVAGAQTTQAPISENVGMKGKVYWGGEKAWEPIIVLWDSLTDEGKRSLECLKDLKKNKELGELRTKMGTSTDILRGHGEKKAISSRASQTRDSDILSYSYLFFIFAIQNKKKIHH
jgi:hypothetical protein